MEYQALEVVRNFFLSLLIIAATGCSSEIVDCGGKIYPEKISAEELQIIKKTENYAKLFCGKSEMACDFTIAKTEQGWSVAATRTFVANGKCSSRIGDEKFYQYNKYGILLRALDGA